MSESQANDNQQQDAGQQSEQPEQQEGLNAQQWEGHYATQAEFIEAQQKRLDDEANEGNDASQDDPAGQREQQEEPA